MLQTSSDVLLRRVDVLNREMERLRRDILREIASGQPFQRRKESLFGSVSSEDIPDEMITRAQKRLFRDLDDI